MPGASLINSYLKTTRAKDHLESLRLEIQSYREGKPYTILGEDDPYGSRYRVSIQLSEVPAKIPLILGDLAYCLRSALDQLVFSLAQLNVAYPVQTEFPIIDSWNHASRRRFAQQTKDVPEQARSIIQSLQPYNAPDRTAIRLHMLWILEKLCVIDKHRRIPTRTVDVTFENLLPVASRDSVTIERLDNPTVLSLPIQFKSQIKLNPSLSLKVVFGDSVEGVACGFEVVEHVYHFVTDRVIPRFAGFFQQQI